MKFVLLLCCLSGVLAGAPVLGSAYQVVYQADFSSDPGWTTDQPGNYYWDAGTGTYHATTENAPPGAPAPPPPPPTRYAHTGIDYGGNSFRLEFDMLPTDIQWSAAVQFGLYNEVLALSEQNPETAGARAVYVQLGRADGGIFLSLYVIDSDGMAQYDQVYNVYSEGTWYHFELEYHCSTDAVNLVMTERGTGTPIAALQVVGFGGLPNTLDYLGFARDPAGWNCPGALGYGCSSEATAYLDNVVFSEGTLNLEYQETFSSDPGWITDQPGNYFWDAGTGTYHATTENAPPGAPAPPPPPPTRYAYTPINYDGNSMKLTFDMQPTDIQWSAAVQFGLYNHVLAGWEQDPETVGARGVYVLLGRADGGIYVQLLVINSDGTLQDDYVYNVYSEGIWYHFEMEYWCSTDAVNLVMTERGTGAPIAALQVVGFGGLPNTLVSCP